MTVEAGRLERIFRAAVRGRLYPEEPLRAHTSFRVGGPADLLFFPADSADLRVALPRPPAEVGPVVRQIEADRAGHDRRIDREVHAADEFRGDMGCICRASTISEEQHLVAFAKGGHEQLGNLNHSIGMFAYELLLDCRAFGKGVEDKIFHRFQF